jgi:hypothetical protein
MARCSPEIDTLSGRHSNAPMHPRALAKAARGPAQPGGRAGIATACYCCHQRSLGVEGAQLRDSVGPLGLLPLVHKAPQPRSSLRRGREDVNQLVVGISVLCMDVDVVM